MKNLIRILSLIALLSVCAWADVTDDLDMDTTHGWTAKQAAQWQAVQFEYAETVKRYGPNSPEATGAQVMMRTRARTLGIKAPEEIPQEAPILRPPLPADVVPEEPMPETAVITSTEAPTTLPVSTSR